MYSKDLDRAITHEIDGVYYYDFWECIKILVEDFGKSFDESMEIMEKLEIRTSESDPVFER